MKTALLVLAMIFEHHVACHAQNASSTVPHNRVFTHADTLQALHTIFRTGRTWGKVLTGFAPVAIGIVAYSASRMDIGGYNVIGGNSSDPNNDAYVTFLGAPVALTLSLVGPLSWKANSEQTEQETIRAYEQHLPLSKRMQRRLHNQLERTLLNENTPSR